MTEDDDRHSYIISDDAIETDPDIVAKIEAENGIRQFDAVTRMIQDAILSDRPFRLRASDILELNRLAIAGINKSAGLFRGVGVGIGKSAHEPPPPENVPRLIEEFCDYVNDSWHESPIHLAAYTLWRVNWIHPFIDGNGRTARATSYYVLNARLGYLLPGRQTIPEQISENKPPYYAALESADAAFKSGGIDTSRLEEMLGDW